MSVASEIQRIKTNIANAYTELESKGATIPADKNSDNLASTVTTVTTGGGTTPEKGLVIEEWDADGYATKAKIIGFTDIPAQYCYQLFGTYNLLGKRISSVSLSEDIKTIGDSAFYYCGGVDSINLPSELETIGTSAFEACQYTVFEDLPDTITSIGPGAFASCNNAKFTKLPSKITTIPDNCFSACKSMTINEIPANIKSLGYRCLAGTNGITNLKILGDISQIPSQFMISTTSITKLDIYSQAITTIQNQSFQGCSKLSTLIIRKTSGVVSLASTGAFGSSGITNSKGTIYVPDDLVNSYKSASNWSTYASRFKGLSELPAE